MKTEAREYYKIFHANKRLANFYFKPELSSGLCSWSLSVHSGMLLLKTQQQQQQQQQQHPESASGVSFVSLQTTRMRLRLGLKRAFNTPTNPLHVCQLLDGHRKPLGDICVISFICYSYNAGNENETRQICPVGKLYS